MTRLVPLLVLFVILVAAVGCASSATPGPSPAATTTLPREPTLAPIATASPTGRLAATATPTESPNTGDGDETQVSPALCAPTAPLGVSVGDSWTLAGSIKVTGPFPGEIPQDADSQSATFLVTETGDWVERIRGGDEKIFEDSRVIIAVTREIRDATGGILSTDEQQDVGVAASVVSLSPVLNLAWECHKAAWLAGWPGGEPAVEERLLPSGVTAVVFSSVLQSPLPGEGSEMSVEFRHGWDKLTGRTVLQETSATGSRDGAAFSMDMTMELVSDFKDPVVGAPEWLRSLIRRLENEPVANPPLAITQYEYRGQPVYYVPPRCCDIFSDLYDADGNIIGHPDGGTTGQGDGRISDFFETRSNESVIWSDERGHDPDLVETPAPIESVEILILESFPPQYNVTVVSGLPNSCVSFAGYRLESREDTIKIKMINHKPADSQVLCAMVYGTVETRISLGSDFESGTKYTIEVNDVTETFVAQ